MKMKEISFKGLLALSTATFALTGANNVVYAEDGAEEIEEVMVIGTRRATGSAADTPAPVDIISGAEFTRNAASDVQALLRTSVPSYNVNA